MVNVEISDYVKAKLDGLKESEGHKSLDSVVRVLLEKSKREETKETKWTSNLLKR